MEITALRELHKKMRVQNITHQNFRIKSGAIIFECIFSAPPFELTMTTSNTKEPQFFLFPVKEGYFISPNFGDDYKRLANTLRTHDESFSPFQPLEFLKEINSKIPSSLTNIPTVEDICRLRHDVEERDKPYFDTWIEWKNGQKPSKENLEKTRLLIGEKAYLDAIKFNQSSRWLSQPK